MDTATALYPSRAAASAACALSAILWAATAAADLPTAPVAAADPSAAPAAKAPPAPAAPAIDDAAAAGRYEDSITATIDDGSLQRKLAVVTGSVGFAGLVVGGVFGILAISRWNDVKAAAASCRDPVGFNGCSATAKADQSAASSYATVSTYGFAAGSVFLTGAITMWYLAPRRPKPTGRIQILPVVGPGGAGGLVTGAF